MITILKQISLSKLYIGKVGGYNFQHVAGGLYKFETSSNLGYCYKKTNDKFKYAKCMFI